MHFEQSAMLQTWTFGGSLNACTADTSSNAIRKDINDAKFISLFFVYGFWNLSCTKLHSWKLLEWSVFILAVENTKMALQSSLTHALTSLIWAAGRLWTKFFGKIIEKIVEFINFAWGLTFRFELDHYVLYKLPL